MEKPSAEEVEGDGWAQRDGERSHSLGYGYNAGGNVTSRVDYDYSLSGSDQYDGLDRLTGVSETGTGGEFTADYCYLPRTRPMSWLC